MAELVRQMQVVDGGTVRLETTATADSITNNEPLLQAEDDDQDSTRMALGGDCDDCLSFRATPSKRDAEQDEIFCLEEKRHLKFSFK